MKTAVSTCDVFLHFCVLQVFVVFWLETLSVFSAKQVSKSHAVTHSRSTRVVQQVPSCLVLPNDVAQLSTRIARLLVESSGPDLTNGKSS